MRWSVVVVLVLLNILCGFSYHRSCYQTSTNYRKDYTDDQWLNTNYVYQQYKHLLVASTNDISYPTIACKMSVTDSPITNRSIDVTRQIMENNSTVDDYEMYRSVAALNNADFGTSTISSSNDFEPANNRINFLLTNAAKVVASLDSMKQSSAKGGLSIASLFQRKANSDTNNGTASNVQKRLKSFSLSFSSSTTIPIQFDNSGAAIRYLSLPASEYSVLDSGLISRSRDSNDTFVLSLPLGDLTDSASPINTIGNFSNIDEKYTRTFRIVATMQTSVVVKPNPTKGEVIMESGPIFFIPTIERKQQVNFDFSSFDDYEEELRYNRLGDEDNCDVNNEEIFKTLEIGLSEQIQQRASIFLPDWLQWGGQSQVSDEKPGRKVGRLNRLTSFTGESRRTDINDTDKQFGDLSQNSTHSSGAPSIKSSIQAGFKVALTWDTSATTEKRSNTIGTAEPITESILLTEEQVEEFNISCIKLGKELPPPMPPVSEPHLFNNENAEAVHYYRERSKHFLEERGESALAKENDFELRVKKQNKQLEFWNYANRWNVDNFERSLSQSFSLIKQKGTATILAEPSHALSSLWLRRLILQKLNVFLRNCKNLELMLLKYFQQTAKNTRNVWQSFKAFLISAVQDSVKLWKVAKQVILVYSAKCALAIGIIFLTVKKILSRELTLQEGWYTPQLVEIRQNFRDISTSLLFLFYIAVSNVYCAVVEYVNELLLHYKVFKKPFFSSNRFGGNAVFQKVGAGCSSVGCVGMNGLNSFRRKFLTLWGSICSRKVSSGGKFSETSQSNRNHSDVIQMSSAAIETERIDKFIAQIIGDGSDDMIMVDLVRSEKIKEKLKERISVSEIQNVFGDDIDEKIHSIEADLDLGGENDAVVSKDVSIATAPEVSLQLALEQSIANNMSDDAKSSSQVEVPAGKGTTEIDRQFYLSEHYLDEEAVVSSEDVELDVKAKVDVWVDLNLPLKEELANTLSFPLVKLLLSQAGTLTTTTILRTVAPNLVDLLKKDYEKRKKEWM